ncbi:exported hypothetical protein [Xenorhabdus bovienii str. kraussei Becker Underwood]|uniref:Uncharacterized protein n=1 Tax=Xenorhabdus bovienii str. kraussei Becker Underwood TaxID=1398204 RepID=A0A077PQZ2_XENBV|nr:exported hypothetical protein [Xenorhabdus bovienii str. kraussei Becker Underwood]
MKNLTNCFYALFIAMVISSEASTVTTLEASIIIKYRLLP